MLGVSSEWPARLSSATAHNLYRIVEEALNNVRLHSGAGRVDVLLAANGDGVELTVRDDGRGLPASDGERRQGMGMMGMRERAVLLGGALDVTSNGSGGTTVKAVVPRAAKESTT
jgi:two-component system sensor histidine kinase UhpB